MEENPNQNQKRPIDQTIMRMKLREYSNPIKRQTCTRISNPLVDNMTFRINPYML